MRRQWETEDLIDQWTLHAEERALLGNKTGATWLGFAVLLKYFQRTGRFPQHKNEVPGMVITYLATQVDVNVATYLQYDWEGRTIEYHRAQIRTALGFREASVVDGEIMSQWLAEHVLPHEHQEDMVRQSCYQHFRLQHLEPPKPDRITRIIRSAYRSFETRLYETTVDSLDEKARAALDVLLIEASPQDADQATNEEPVTLHTLRMDPGQVGVETVLKEVAKLQQIRALGLPKDLFSHLSPKVLRSYRQRASAEAPSHLRAHPEAIRYTLLAALCWQRNQEITDSLVDLLIQLVHRIGARAERKVEEVYVAELKRVIGKESILYHIADAAVKQPDGLVRDVVFPVASETLLQDLIKEYESKGPVFRRQVHLVMRSSYRSHYRRILPHLLDVLEFHCNNELYQPIIRAVTLVKDYVHSPRQYYPEEEIVPIKDIVKAKWRDLVVEKDEDGTEKVNRINYEVCLLQALRDKVRSKEIWVVGANRYQNPDLDLPTDFEQQRTDYYEALKQPTEASAFVEQVRTSLQEALRSLDAAMPRLSPKVKILTRRNGWIHLSPLEAQPEPTNLARLKLDVAREWPMTSLLDMLKETDLQVGFTDLFTSISQREILPRETLQKRVLLCLYGLGNQYRTQAPRQCRSRNDLPGSTLCQIPLYSQRAVAQCDWKDRQCHLCRAEGRDLGGRNNGVRIRLEEVWSLEPKLAHRVAYSLPRAWDYGVLARGEIATNRLDDQEVAVLSLHLLQICLVYINTLMIQQVLSSEQWKGKLTVPDYRGLSPLFYSHVNPYGTFRLDMNERLRLEA